MDKTLFLVFIVVSVFALAVGSYLSIVKRSQPATVFMWSWLFLLVIIVLYPIHIGFTLLSVLGVAVYLFCVFGNVKQEQIETSHDQTRRVLATYHEKIDEERKRISRILHDTVNQKLIVTKLELRQLLESLSGTEHEASLEKLLHINDEIYQSSRNLIKFTRIEMLETLGIIDAVQELINTYSMLDKDVSFNFSHDAIALENKQATNLYYIISECLLNIIKHAKATNVEVTLVRKKKQIYASVKDDGVGFSKKYADGIGLVDMAERARHLDTELQIETSPEGTCISLSFTPQSIGA